MLPYGMKDPNAKPGAPANRVNTQLLRSLGWTTPEIEQRAEVPQDWLDMGAAKDITAYEYGVGPDELNLLMNAYEGTAGFKPGQRHGKDDPRVTSDVTRAAPLTWEAYNKLSDSQRKAVDFNTMFLQAREKDLTDTDADEQDDAYNLKVEGIFGKGGGSDTYAPNTVDLLEKMGFQAKGQDLDEFLSLDRLISADELEKFAPATNPVVQWELDPKAVGAQYLTNQYADIRSAANQLAVDTLAIEQAGAFIDKAMKDPDVWDRNSAMMKALTGTLPTGMDIPWGFGTDADRMDMDGNLLTEYKGKDEGIRIAYDLLTIPENNMGTLWTQINAAGLDDNQVQEVFNYIDMKTKKDIASGFVDPSIRSPQDIRKMAGLEA